MSSEAWKSGWGSTVEQPEPPEFQAASVQPRAVEASLVRVVPPTATTLPKLDGLITVLPVSPLDAAITTPGWS